ncbi:hypothetical protein BSL78_24674 [Apostichopus japonicus]|uniref:DUF4709 domain-containing protein n=1 Tax=Stichopus japonicus TaxID=307972 RepID=A0A2G8JRS7_STIJA|nr:hypothetical protein BSL78_24674 [Apostichopus japonicus]
MAQEKRRESRVVRSAKSETAEMVETHNVENGNLSVPRHNDMSFSPTDVFSPSIADQQKVGFFRQDKATQTEDSEIVELKDMTKVLQILLQESKALKRELAVARQVIVAEYENRLQEKAIDMYTRINDRLEQLENAHQERIAVVRRSYRTQLADAIARITNEWKKHANSKMNMELRKDASRSAKVSEDHKQLQQQLSQQENIIQMLKMQLEQQAQEVRSEASTPSAVYEAEHLRDELGQLQNKIDSLEESLDVKEETLEEFKNDVERLNRELEKEKVRVKQLESEMDEQQANAAQEMSSLRRIADKQRMQMEKDIQDKMKKAREDMLNIAKDHAAEQQRQEQEKARLLKEQKKAETALRAKEKAQQVNAIKSEEELFKIQRTERNLRMEINRLKKELARTTKMWEKKFAILQKSLYAIKDESYLRQTLQKQAAALHHVSVSYASDRPMGMVPTSEPLPAKKSPLQPLPGISRPPTTDRQMLSPYTLSPPPGRGVEVFSVAESQIMDANEYFDMDAEGILPIPSPPIPAMRWEESRPSTSQRMLAVTPTA